MKLVVDTNRIIAALIRDSTSRKILLSDKIDFLTIEVTKLDSIVLKERCPTCVGNSHFTAENISAATQIRMDLLSNAERFLRYVGRRTTLVKIRSRFKVVKDDPKVDVVLNTAHSGEAEYIVSGDRHLVPQRIQRNKNRNRKLDA